MANTLSQYIGQIIDRRNQELQQRLAPLIPLLQADLAETKARAEIERQKQLRIADYGTMADQSFGEGSSAEWLERAKQYQTPEGADAGWKLFASEKGQAKEGIDYGNLLRSFGVPEDKITEAVGKLGSIESEAGRELIMKEYLQFANTNIELTRNTAQRVSPEYAADFEKNLAETGDVDKAVGYANKRQAERDEQAQVRNSYRGRGGSVNPGGGGQQQEIYSVTEETKKAINRAYYTDSKGQWVKMVINGDTYKIPATVGSDGRLYVVGEQGAYLINPSNCSDPSTPQKFQASAKLVDRYFGGVETKHTGGNTQQTGTNPNNTPAALPAGVRPVNP